MGIQNSRLVDFLQFQRVKYCTGLFYLLNLSGSVTYSIFSIPVIFIRNKAAGFSFPTGRSLKCQNPQSKTLSPLTTGATTGLHTLSGVTFPLLSPVFSEKFALQVLNTHFTDFTTSRFYIFSTISRAV